VLQKWANFSMVKYVAEAEFGRRLPAESLAPVWSRVYICRLGLRPVESLESHMALGPVEFQGVNERTAIRESCAGSNIFTGLDQN
jgi:hypothetical protein